MTEQTNREKALEGISSETLRGLPLENIAAMIQCSQVYAMLDLADAVREQTYMIEQRSKIEGER